MKENRMLAAVKTPENKIWGILYAIAAVFLVQIFFAIGSFIGSFLISFLFDLLPTEAIQFLMFTIDPLFITLMTFTLPALLICLWVIAVERRSAVGLGLFKKNAWLELSKGWLVGFLLITAVVALQWTTGSIQLFQFDFSTANIISLVLIMPFWFIQSGTEELLTRGWLFPLVSRNSNLWIGTAVSSLLFAVLHLGNPSVTWISILNIALFGLLACLYVLKTDNIWGISAIHAAWNCFQGSFFGLNVSGLSTAYAPMRFENGTVPEFMSGGGFGPEGSLFSSLVLGTYSAWLIWSILKERRAEQ